MAESGSYFSANINKFVTLAFSILFCYSLYIFVESANLVFVFTLVILILLNILNFATKMRLSAFFESLIFELIGLMGIFYISWLYVLVFVLVAETIHFFKNKVILISTMVLNSIFYLVLYLIFMYNGTVRGFYPWYAFGMLFISIGLSVYFVKSELEYVELENNESIERLEKEDIKKRYNELLKDHKDMLLLKEIMELSTKNFNIQEMVSKINSQLMRSLDNIDYTTLFLYDEKRKEYNVISSNVPSSFHKLLSEIDEFDQFWNVIENKDCVVLNGEVGLGYPTAPDRNIYSAICFPLHTNKEMGGIILLESQTPYAFENIDINQFNIIRYNISLIVENKRWVEKIQRMALVDGLTGVYNRNYLFDFLNTQMKWHKENTKRFSLVLFDIDHFKKFNDTYGHLFGDLVLKEVCKLVKEMIRETDLIARYGGEEFIIILVDTNLNLAKERIEEIRLAIQNMTVKDEEETEAKVTVSFGIAEFGENSYNINDKQLIERADKALYISKEQGRNRVTLYQDN